MAFSGLTGARWRTEYQEIQPLSGGPGELVTRGPVTNYYQLVTGEVPVGHVVLTSLISAHCSIIYIVIFAMSSCQPKQQFINYVCTR